MAVSGFALSLFLLPLSSAHAATAVEHWDFSDQLTGVLAGTVCTSGCTNVVTSTTAGAGWGAYASTTGSIGFNASGTLFQASTRSFTLSYWIKGPNIDSNYSPFYTGDLSSNGWRTQGNTSGVYLYACLGTCSVDTKPETWPDHNGWHMFTFERNAGNKIYVYWDGALYASGTDAGTDPGDGGDLRLAAAHAQYDEVWFFDGALTQNEITNLYTYNSISSTHSLTLDWPINASTTDFSNWTIDDIGIASSTSGTYGIQYGTSSGNLDHIDTVQIVNGTGPARVGSTKYVQIPNAFGLNMSKTATSWYAQPYYFDAATFTFTYGLKVHFTIDTSVIYPNISTLNVSSSVVNLSGPFPGSAKAWFTPSSTDIYGLNCDNTSSTEIGFGVAYASCNVIDWLFIPSQFSVQTLGDGFLSFQKVPPMSFLFTAINTVSSSITAAEASSSASTTLISYKGATASAGPNALRDGFSQQVKDTLWTWQDHALWALAFLGAIGTILQL